MISVQYLYVNLCGACMVTLYSKKFGKYDCRDSTGISLLSVVNELCGRVPITRVVDCTECASGEKQYDFSSNMCPPRG